MKLMQTNTEYSVEPLAVLLIDGLESLARKHWQEVYNKPDDFEFDPDWKEVKAAEDSGRMRWFCARHDGVLVGYASLYLVKSMPNKGKMIAVIQDLFLSEERRGTNDIFGLLRFVISTAKTIGASKVFAYEPVESRVGVLYKRLRFRPTECVWA